MAARAGVGPDEGPPGALLAIGVAGFALCVAGVVVRAVRDEQLGYALVVSGLAATLGTALVYLALVVDRWDRR
jgi:hypothetical protein